MTRFYQALPLLVAAAAVLLASPNAMAASVLLVGLLVAMALGPRLPLDKPTQRLTSLVIVILVIAGIRAAGIPVRGPKLGAFAFGFAVAPLAVAAFRLTVTRAEWGYIATGALGFLSIMACGGARLGPVYGALVACYLAAVLIAFRATDPDRVPAARLPRSAVTASGFIVALACAMAVGAAVTIRPLAELAQSRIERSMIRAMQSRVAFADSMRLGRMANLLESDRVVMRVRGPRVDRLRGAVLDHYEGVRWMRKGGGQPRTMSVGRGPLQGDGVVEIHKLVTGDDRLFLPLMASGVATPSGTIGADDHGIARVPGEGAPPIVWLRDGARDAMAVAHFTAEDLVVPPEIEGFLQSLASRWAEGERTPEGALVAIERRLRSDYRYALVHERRTRGDPVLDFLLEHREGHCEYFASAMTLLARSIGVPARIVTGYRVGERNPFLGHYVVRDKNAHAWVEAWIPGRAAGSGAAGQGQWLTFDPTPMSELMQNELHDQRGLTALTELVLAGSRRVEAWLAERTVGELAVAAVLGLALFVAVRLWNTRRKVATTTHDRALEFSTPSAAYAAFEARLAQQGLPRPESEALEVFAERLPQDAAALVRRYARVRYGGETDERLEEELGLRQ